MGKSTQKSIVDKEKSSTTRISAPTNSQRRSITVANAARRRTIGTIMRDTTQDRFDDDDTAEQNSSSVPPNQSDMSGDEDDERSQRCNDVEKKISPLGVRSYRYQVVTLPGNW